MNVIKESVAQQDRDIALVDCVTGWDGCVDEGTIRQGIFDRMKAMGRPIEDCLTITRLSLFTTVIDFDGYSVSMCKADTPKLKLGHILGGKSFEQDGVTYWYNFNEVDSYFHENEIKLMTVYLTNNFYH